MKTQLVSALLCFAALGACVDAADSTDDTATADPRIATNGLVPGAIHSNNLNTKALTSANIQATPGMLDTNAHQIYTSYLVGCALTPSQSVTVYYLGQNLVFPGGIGLAPAWTTRALTQSEELDVSACVLARANLTGTSVTISVRGDSPALATTFDERTNYNVEEAAFYGDVFSTSTIAKRACNGVDQVRDGDTYGDLPLRQCGQPDPNNPGYTLCGFIFDGNCADVCTFNVDHYESCPLGAVNVETVRLYGTAP
jgi:hypothetical protein